MKSAHNSLSLSAVLLIVVAGLFFASLKQPAQAINVPQFIGFEGQLTNSSGSALTATYDIVFRIYDVETGGTALWTETQSNVSVDNGFFAVTLGDTTTLNLDFDTRYWIGVTVATDAEMTPRQPIDSVGYAFATDVTYGTYTSTTAPTAAAGRLYYDTDDNNLYVYDSGAASWVDLTAQGTTFDGRLSDTDILQVTNGTVTSTLAANYLAVATSTANALGLFYVDTSGNVSTSGTLDVFGNTTLGNDATADTITLNARFASDIDPSTNNTRDLGAYGLAFNDLFASNTLYVGGTGTQVSIDSNSLDSEGAFTITTVNAGTDITLRPANTGQIVLDPTANVLPGSNNTDSLGEFSTAWQHLFSSGTAYLTTVDVAGAVTSTIVTTSQYLAVGDINDNPDATYNNGSVNVGGLIFTTGGILSTGSSTYTGDLTIGNGTEDTLQVYSLIGTNLEPATNDDVDLGGFGNAWTNLFSSGTIFGNVINTVGNTTLGNGDDLVTVNSRFASSLEAGANNTFDLGAYGNAWANIYSSSTSFLEDVSISGGIQPVANNASTIGAFGSALADIYASGTLYIAGITSGQINPNSNGNQDIGGYGNAWANIFSSGTLFVNEVDVVSAVSASANNTVSIGEFGLAFADFYSSGTSYLNSAITGQIRPDGNNNQDLGEFGSAWANLFASGTANLSDVVIATSLNPNANDSIDLGSFDGSAAWQNIYASSSLIVGAAGAQSTYAGDSITSEGGYTLNVAGANQAIELVTTNDGNILLYSNTNSALVGINTNAPDRILEINSDDGSNLRLTYNDADGTATNYADFTMAADGQLTILTAGTDADFELGTANFANAIEINDSVSRIGIGTSGPGATLDINAATGNNLRLTYNDNDGSAENYADFSLASDGALQIFATGTDADVELRTDNTDNAIYIDDSANRIGFFTDIPADGDLYTLAQSSDIIFVMDTYSSTAGHSGILRFRRARGTEASPTATQEDDVLGQLEFQGYDTGFGDGAIIEGVADAEWGTAGDNSDEPTRLSFYTTPDGSDVTTERLRITSDGNIGIGSSTPFAYLSVDAPGTNGDPIFIVGSTTDRWFEIADDGSIGLGGAANSGFIETYYPVQPNQDNIDNLGDTGNRWAEVFAGVGTINTSDEREKENIESLEYGLQEILQLHPVSYTWIRYPEKGNQIGFIAQEVQPVISEPVNTPTNPEHMLGLKYNQFIPVLVKAIQEQQVLIEDLQGGLAQNSNQSSNITPQTNVFEGDVVVKGTASFGGDSVGYARVLSGDRKVDVVFDEKYERQPIITVTPRGEHGYNVQNYSVTNESTTGFTITMLNPLSETVEFSWHAFGVEEGRVYISDRTYEDIEIVIGEDQIPPTENQTEQGETESSEEDEENSDDGSGDDSDNSDEENEEGDDEDGENEGEDNNEEDENTDSSDEENSEQEEEEGESEGESQDEDSTNEEEEETSEEDNEGDEESDDNSDEENEESTNSEENNDNEDNDQDDTVTEDSSESEETDNTENESEEENEEDDSQSSE